MALTAAVGHLSVNPTLNLEGQISHFVLDALWVDLVHCCQSYKGSTILKLISNQMRLDSLYVIFGLFTQFLSEAIVVKLRSKHLSPTEIVALHCSGQAGEVLAAVGWGPETSTETNCYIMSTSGLMI